MELSAETYTSTATTYTDVARQNLCAVLDLDFKCPSSISIRFYASVTSVVLCSFV